MECLLNKNMFAAKVMMVALLVGFSLSHSLMSIPIEDVKASANLLDQGVNTFRPENLVMKKKVHPFYQVWGAAFKNKPITLEFTVSARRVDMITIFNGYMRDSSSYVNYALAKNVKVYQNSKDNLVKSVTLAKPKWGGFQNPTSDMIIFDKPLENVYKLIVEIEDIYPGKKRRDVCIALVKIWGFTKLPRKLKAGQMKDSRDGNVYKTLDVGDRTWMVQDLRYRAPGSRTFSDPDFAGLKLPADVGLEYSESDIDKGICPDGWRLPSSNDFLRLKDELPGSASFDDLFSTFNRKPFYSIYEYGNLGEDRYYPTDVEMLFYPTDIYGLNFSTLTRHYYDGECSEENGENFAFSSYWTSDAKEIPLWPDENGDSEVKNLRHYRFGGSEYCEAMLCRDDYHFVRCIKGGNPDEQMDEN